MKYDFIEQYNRKYGTAVRLLCRVLEVSSSGYYRHLANCQHRLAAEHRQNQMLQLMRQIQQSSYGSYGSRRMSRELKRRGYCCNRKRAVRLMRKGDSQATMRRRRVRTTLPGGPALTSENLLGRNFQASKANTVWVTDTTFIPTHQGWLYLTVVLDLFCRRVVGWAFSGSNDHLMVKSAIEMALQQRQLSTDNTLILHSDRGSTFTAEAISTLLIDNDMQRSLSRRANPYDNAPAESFFASLKKECIRGRVFDSPELATRVIFEYMEIFYNRTRLHSALGYSSPLHFEQQHSFS